MKDRETRLYAYDEDWVCWHVDDLSRSVHKGVDFYDELGNVYRPIAVELENAKRSTHFRLYTTMRKSGDKGQTGESPIHRKIKDMFFSQKEIIVSGETLSITNPKLEQEYGFYRKGEDRLRAEKWRVVDLDCEEFALEVIVEHNLGYKKRIFLEALGKTIILVDAWKMIDALRGVDKGKSIKELLNFTFEDVLQYTSFMQTQKQTRGDIIKKREENNERLRGKLSETEDLIHELTNQKIKYQNQVNELMVKLDEKKVYAHELVSQIRSFTHADSANRKIITDLKNEIEELKKANDKRETYIVGVIKLHSHSSYVVVGSQAYRYNESLKKALYALSIKKIHVKLFYNEDNRSVKTIYRFENVNDQ